MLSCTAYFYVSLQYLALYRLSLSIVVFQASLSGEQGVIKLGLHSGTTLAVGMVISLLRIGGVPPIVGFYAKLAASLTIIELFGPQLVLFIFLVSIYILYIYIRIFFYMVTFGQQTPLLPTHAEEVGWAPLLLLFRVFI